MATTIFIIATGCILLARAWQTLFRFPKKGKKAVLSFVYGGICYSVLWAEKLSYMQITQTTHTLCVVCAVCWLIVGCNKSIQIAFHE